jgi:putative zinc finger/helix-turn-helix YgiT family protein
MERRRTRYETRLTYEGMEIPVVVPDLEVIVCANPACHPEHPDDTILTDGDAAVRIGEAEHEALAQRFGLLRPSEIRAGRERLGMTQKQLQEMLGLGGNSLSRWETGEVFHSRSLDMLLRLTFADPEHAKRVRGSLQSRGEGPAATEKAGDTSPAEGRALHERFPYRYPTPARSEECPQVRAGHRHEDVLANDEEHACR